MFPAKGFSNTAFDGAARAPIIGAHALAAGER
jgi:hypothetical protein